MTKKKQLQTDYKIILRATMYQLYGNQNKMHIFGGNTVKISTKRRQNFTLNNSLQRN